MSYLLLAKPPGVLQGVGEIHRLLQAHILLLIIVAYAAVVRICQHPFVKIAGLSSPAMLS